jgi:very-short-patch-repair endonuclease
LRRLFYRSLGNNTERIVFTLSPLWERARVRGAGHPKKMESNINKLAKTLRRGQTDAESLLWKHLRTKQMEGIKFRRQQPIGRFIVDFVSFEKKVIIEVDGGQHSEEADRDREQWLRSQGFNVLRFWNNEVLENTEGVLQVIRKNSSLTLP